MSVKYGRGKKRIVTDLTELRLLFTRKKAKESFALRGEGGALLEGSLPSRKRVGPRLEEGGLEGLSLLCLGRKGKISFPKERGEADYVDQTKKKSKVCMLYLERDKPDRLGRERRVKEIGKEERCVSTF